MMHHCTLCWRVMTTLHHCTLCWRVMTALLNVNDPIPLVIFYEPVFIARHRSFKPWQIFTSISSLPTEKENRYFSGSLNCKPVRFILETSINRLLSGNTKREKEENTLPFTTLCGCIQCFRRHRQQWSPDRAVGSHLWLQLQGVYLLSLLGRRGGTLVTPSGHKYTSVLNEAMHWSHRGSQICI